MRGEAQNWLWIIDALAYDRLLNLQNCCNAVSDYAVSDLARLFSQLKTSRWVVRPGKRLETFFEL